MDISDLETPLLEDAVDGVVDYKGLSVFRSSSGGWRSASFIIGVEVAERFAYYGIESNLITYLTGPLGQPTATAAQTVNVWDGTSLLLPLLGAFLADCYLGRFRTIVVASLLYILGLGLLTISAMLPSVNVSECQRTHEITSCSPSQFQMISFFFSLYLLAVSESGHKPCVQAFGADQFDEQDIEESKAKSSFFNWWYFGLCGGCVVTIFVVPYIQDNLSWGLGFGIPCIAMVVALIVFLLGTRTYRHSIRGDGKSPFVRIGKVFIAAFRNRKRTLSAIGTEEETHGIIPDQGFLNKALLTPDELKEDGKLCSINEVEEAKVVVGLVPIWLTCLIFAVVSAQSSTFFTKQGVTMERTIFDGFEIPAASLQSFIAIAIILILPIYDRIFVPLVRTYTRKPSGITMLQRIGTGMFLSALSMVVAALVEMKRLKTVKEYDIVDFPSATAPMSIWWLVPQYLLLGMAEAFTTVGLQEFFYDQVPNELRSIGLALYLSIFGVGYFLSSFLISAIEKVTSEAGHDSWFPNNLNHAHLDYFYWLLAGFSAVELATYWYVAKSYIYKKRDRV